MRQVVILEPNRLVREGLARLLAEGGFVVVDSTRVGDLTRIGDLDGPLVRDQAVDLVLTELPTHEYRMAGWLERIAACYPRAKIVLLTVGPARPDVVRSALASGAHGYVDKNVSFTVMHAVIDAVLHGQIVCPSALRDYLLSSERATPIQQVEESARSAGEPAVSPYRQQQLHTRRVGDLPAPDMPAHPDSAPVTEVHATNGQAEPERGAVQIPPAKTAESPQVNLSERETEILHHLTKGYANKIIAHRLEISEATVKTHLKSLLRKLHFSNRTQAAIWAVNHYGPGGSAEERVPG